jgi:hypothetical protein
MEVKDIPRWAWKDRRWPITDHWWMNAEAPKEKNKPIESEKWKKLLNYKSTNLRDKKVESTGEQLDEVPF